MSAGNGRGKRKRREYACGLTVRRSLIDGRGCFATIFIPRGARIAEYAGEKITQEEGLLRLRRQRKKRVSTVDANWCIDGSVGGNGTEYINHSCHPNCGVIARDGQINIHALRDIAPGEELTVDYLDDFDFKRGECGCEAEVCRGRAGKRRSISRVKAS
ncbi:MAG TPA: SET domain-containing protein-lysine N-methyltransferase [Blastocatellia bacterium]|nr:SET domain-containing protein-lysine N-methyltransferase [Blastocatellia bacterium]